MPQGRCNVSADAERDARGRQGDDAQEKQTRFVVFGVPVKGRGGVWDSLCHVKLHCFGKKNRMTTPACRPAAYHAGVLLDYQSVAGRKWGLGVTLNCGKFG
jgi:hypothetical protein